MSTLKQRYCKLCDGPLVVLGTLGSLRHFRCQDCGIGFNVRVRSRQKWSKYSRFYIAPVNTTA